MVDETSRETAEGHELGPTAERSSMDSDYREIRDRLGLNPDVEQLKGCEAADRQIEQQRKGEPKYGHVIEKHCSTSDYIQNRADKVGQRPENKRAAHITRFKSEQAMMAAAATNWGTPEAQEQRERAELQYKVAREAGASKDELAEIARLQTVDSTVPAEAALGDKWIDHVEGYTTESRGSIPTDFGDNAKILTIWRMKPDGTWYILTSTVDPVEREA